MRFSHLCRICLSSDQELTILSETIAPKLQTLPVGVLEIWQIFSKILVTNDEESSDHICISCARSIADTYALIVKAEKSSDVLRNLGVAVKNEPMDCENSTELSNVEQLPDETVAVDPFETGGMSNAMLEAPAIKEEISCDDDEEEVNFDDYPDIANNYANNLARTQHEDAEEEEDQTEDSNRLFECPVCNFMSTLKVELEEHIAGNHVEGNVCSICKEVIFTTKSKHMGQHLAANMLADGNSDDADKLTRSLYQCTSCLRVLPSQFLYDEHMAVHFKLLRPFKCGHCTKMFRFRTSLLEHIRAEHGSFDFTDCIEQVQCVMCWKIFQTKDALLLHLQHHEDAPEELTCTHCSRSFTSMKYLNMHITERHPVQCPETKRYQCMVCKKMIGGKYSLGVHLRTHRNEFKCEHCTKTYQTLENLQKHISRHHTIVPDSDTTPSSEDNTKSDDSSFPCTVCSKIFKRSIQLKTHMRTHNGEKPFPCEQCPAAFRYKSMLKTHMSNVHFIDAIPDLTTLTEGYYRCEICSRIFLQRWELTKHLLTHTGMKFYQCDKCPKRFASQGNFMYHLRVHAGDTPFSCDQCPKTFRSKNNLTNHKERTHSGDPGVQAKFKKKREYGCDICLKTFNAKSVVKMHMIREHVEENDCRMPKCSICCKVFPTPSTLRLHMRKHSQDTPYPCKYCPRMFRYEASVAYHMRTKHWSEDGRNAEPVKMKEVAGGGKG